jgi:hypothetical protein
MIAEYFHAFVDGRCGGERGPMAEVGCGGENWEASLVAGVAGYV